MCYTIHGTRYTGHGTQYTAHGTWYTIHGAGYKAQGTGYRGQTVSEHCGWYGILYRYRISIALGLAPAAQGA